MQSCRGVRPRLSPHTHHFELVDCTTQHATCAQHSIRLQQRQQQQQNSNSSGSTGARCVREPQATCSLKAWGSAGHCREHAVQGSALCGGVQLLLLDGAAAAAADMVQVRYLLL
jgi:hypothetical protein